MPKFRPLGEWTVNPCPPYFEVVNGNGWGVVSCQSEGFAQNVVRGVNQALAELNEKNRLANYRIAEALKHFVDAIYGYNETGVWPDNHTLRQLAEHGKRILRIDTLHDSIESELDSLREQLRIQAEALLSIASDSCFDKCQEAALVASTALAKSDQQAGT